MPDMSSKEIGRLRKRLVRRARRYTADASTAEDLAQEALLNVWVRLRDDPPIADLDRYLYVTLRRLAHRRARPEDELTEALMPHSPPSAAGRMATQAVIAALARLPEAQARLIREHAVEGASFAQLARRHRLPLGTVMSRVARGRTRLCLQLRVPRDRPVEALLDETG